MKNNLKSPGVPVTDTHEHNSRSMENKMMAAFIEKYGIPNLKSTYLGIELQYMSKIR